MSVVPTVACDNGARKCENIVQGSGGKVFSREKS